MRRDNYHLRELKSLPYAEHEVATEFERYVSESLLHRLKLDGYKQKEKRATAVLVLHNLVMTGKRHLCVADSRDSSVRLRTQVWDAIVAADLARVCLGSEQSGKWTRYYARGKLLRHFEGWELQSLLNLDLGRNTQRKTPTDHALVVVRSGRKDSDGKLLPRELQKQPLPLPTTPHGLLRYLSAMEDEIERINLANRSHKWTLAKRHPKTGKLDVIEPNVCLRQVSSKRLGRCSRLYSWSPLSGQSLSKKERKRIRIDGEPVAELDYSGYATRSLYHLEFLDPEGDVYRPEVVMPRIHRHRATTDCEKAILRGFVKRATNICWNVTSRQAAIGAVKNLLRKHEEYDFLSTAIYQTERTSVPGIVERIKRAHPELAHRFFTEIGSLLQSVDGNIMLDILGCFADAGKPALGIHDSVVCKRSDLRFARRVMKQVYRKFYEFDPVIKKA